MSITFASTALNPAAWGCLRHKSSTIASVVRSTNSSDSVPIAAESSPSPCGESPLNELILSLSMIDGSTSFRDIPSKLSSSLRISSRRVNENHPEEISPDFKVRA